MYHRYGRVGIERQQLVLVPERSPDERHHAAIVFDQACVSARRQRIELTRVAEHDFVSQGSVESEDVLDRGQEGEIADCRAKFLVNFAYDGISMNLAQLDTAADQAVVAVGIFDGRRVKAN